MHVNTDSVLLGAWTNGPSNKPCRILDIGTGCGILALMMAQRFAGAGIDAMEIDACAAEEAAANVLSSPWADRICVLQADFRDAVFTHPYDLVICNPPYFNQSLASPDRRRTMARYTSCESLPHRELIEGVAHLLADDGLFSLVLPVAEAREFFSTAAMACKPLFVQRITTVYTKSHKPALRILAQLGRNPVPVVQDTIVMYRDNGQEYSPEYVALVRDFYLWA